MNIWRLSQFCIQAEKSSLGESSGRQRLWIWGKGSEAYQQALQRAFPSLNIQSVRETEFGSFDWLLDIESATAQDQAEIETCLYALCRTLLIESPLHECFALGWHSKPGRPGKPALTTLGNLVHRAKSYSLDPDSAGSLPAAGLIAEQMIEFIIRHPLYRQSDGLVAALPSNPDKAFDLPKMLAQLISKDLGLPFFSQALYKKRRTAQMKHCLSMADKLDNIADSVGVGESHVAGRHLILIDDILESGATLRETARALSQGGANCVVGLVATKTLRRTFK